jgi:hypothetical protein
VNQKKYLEKIKKVSQRNSELRADPRFQTTMSLLVEKKLLMSNQTFFRWNTAKLKLADAIWAGQTLEPRILEVLPAAFAQFEDCFEYTDEEATELRNIISHFQGNKDRGPEFRGISYEKMRKWFLFLR